MTMLLEGPEAVQMLPYDLSPEDVAWCASMAAETAALEAEEARLDEIAAFAAALETYLLENGGAEEQELSELRYTTGRDFDDRD